MDAVANVVMDVVFSSEKHSVFNIVHPLPVAWNTIIESVQETISRKLSKRLETLSFQEWFLRLEVHANDIQRIDSIKLIVCKVILYHIFQLILLHL